jgi:hypothetical protein
MEGTRLRLAVLVVAAAILSTSPRLSLAFEDADDPAPRRFAMTAQVAGQCAGLIISWSVRARSQR